MRKVIRRMKQQRGAWYRVQKLGSKATEKDQRLARKYVEECEK